MKQITVLFILCIHITASVSAQSELKNLLNIYERKVKEKNKDSVLFFAHKIFEIARNNETINVDLFVESLERVSSAHSILYHYDSAIYYQTAAIRKIKSQQKPNNIFLASGYKNISSYYMELAAFGKADSCMRRAIEIVEHTLEPIHDFYISYLLDFGKQNLRSFNLSSADSCIKLVTDLSVKSKGLSDSLFAVAIMNRGMVFQTKCRYDSAFKYLDSSNRLHEKYRGENTYAHAESLYHLSIFFRETGQFKNAEQSSLEVIKILKKIGGEKKPMYANALNNLGIIYKVLAGDFEKARKYYTDAMMLRKELYGEQHLEYAACKNNLGRMYVDMCKLDSARLCFEESISIKKKLIDEHQPGFGESYYNLGEWYRAKGLFDSAYMFFLKSASIRKDIYGDSHVKYANSILAMAGICADLGQFNFSDSLYSIAHGIYLKSLGTENPEYANALFFYGFSLNMRDQLDSAEFYLMNSLNIRRKILGVGHPDYSVSLNELGRLYFKQMKLDLADSCYTESMKYRKQIFGDDSYWYARSLHNMGKLFLKRGDYQVAKSCLFQSLKIIKLKVGELHPYYAEIINSIGSLNRELGKYETADSCYIRALEIRKLIYGEKHPDIAFSLNSLGILYKNNFLDFKRADSFYNASIEIRLQVYGRVHSEYAHSLNNISSLYIELGNYTEAKKLLNESLIIKEKIFGKEHTSYAESLYQLGRVFLLQKQYDSAFIYFTTAAFIHKRKQGIYNDQYSSAISKLGELFMNTGKYDSAYKCYQEVIRIRKKIGLINKDFVKSFSNLACFYDKTGNEAFSKIYFDSALMLINNAKYIKQSNLYHDILLNYARVLIKLHHFDESYSLLRMAFNLKLENTINNFEWFTENQKELFWKKEEDFYEQIYSINSEYHHQIPKLPGLIFDLALSRKSRLLETKIDAENYYRGVEELRDELATKRRLIAKMESEGYVKFINKEQIEREADSLDKQLTEKIPEYAKQKENLKINWQLVQKNLVSNEAAIEFLRYRKHLDSTYLYAAVLIRPDDSIPIWVDVCSENEIRKIASFSHGYQDLYSLIWEPLEPYLTNSRVIYYSPDGLFNQIPFHALCKSCVKVEIKSNPNKKNRGIVVDTEEVILDKHAEYLIDRFELHQMTSTRYLSMGLKFRQQQYVTNTIAMVGGVNYDFLPTKKNKPSRYKNSISGKRSSNDGDAKLMYLKGTQKEVEQIRDTAVKKNWRVELFEADDATEENITRLEGRHSKSILHIATHGYAFPEYDFKNSELQKKSIQYNYRFSTNPMVRSGLILAGGNWAWMGFDTLSRLGADQNGILTALEVSQLNLRKTKLVVLSACETGLGKIEGSEGIFGLKRAFKLAGVEQLIVSLWSVPDKETMELMTSFYSDLTNTMNPVQSFYKAQREMRLRYPNEPEKWAGFVLVR